MKWIGFPGFFCGVALMAPAFSLTSPAATFNIANGDVVGLISAINSSNTNNQDDTINLATNGSYILTSVQDTTVGPSGLPAVVSDYPASTVRKLIINGNGATLTRSTAAGTPEFRLMYVANFGASSTVTINKLTFSNGRLSDDSGGAIFVNGFLFLNDCTFANNSAEVGGAIQNQNRATTLHNCTLRNNAADSTGGAIENLAGDLSLENCTIVNNSSAGVGKALANFGNGRAANCSIVSCTFVSGEIANFEFTHICTITIGNTILSATNLNNRSTNSSFSKITSQGYNLSNQSGDGILTMSTDKINTDPKFDRVGLASNGGPTQTIALSFGSPAIDAGNSFSLSTDQRGVARIYDNAAVANVSDGADIGAFEAGADQPQDGLPSFIVTTRADHDDGYCTGADCTLREAIIAAEQYAFPVTFAPSITGTITLTDGDLYLLSSVQINGPGARTLAVSANRQSRVFNIVAGSSKITGLTIRDGLVTGGTGITTYGGAIYNIAVLELDDCAILHSNVVGGNAMNNTTNPGGAGYGGAICNTGRLNLDRCTIGGPDSNSANGAAGGKGGDRPTTDDILYTGGAGGAGFGGAIFNANGGSMSLTNTTVAGNSATGGTGGAANHGGKGGDAVAGIYNLGAIAVQTSTISTNAAVSGAGGNSEFGANGAAGRADGGLRADSGSNNSATDSIIAGNMRNTGGAPDISGAFTSGGFNLIGINGATGFNSTGDQTGTAAAPRNAMLGPIQNNGGPTDTMLPMTGSPAIDQGKFYTSIDQRRFARPMDNPTLPNATGGDGSDIGAVEVDGSFVRILQIARSGSGQDVTVSFEGTDSKTFRLERKFNITDSWSIIPFSNDTATGHGVGVTAQVTDNNTISNGRAFYRVVQL